MGERVVKQHLVDDYVFFFSSRRRHTRWNCDWVQTCALPILAIECRVGHPVAIRKAEARRQKHDRRDAALLLRLLAEDRFPTIWMPSTELRDLRALLLHRHQWVRMRTRVQNALHAIAMAHGVRRGHTLWNREGQALLASLPLAPHTAHRRSELQALYQHLDAHVDRLGERVKK